MELPEGFENCGTARYREPGPGRAEGPEIQQFRGLGVEWALVPGGEVTLGWTEPGLDPLDGLAPSLREGLEADLFRVRHPAQGYRRWLDAARARGDAEPDLLAWLEQQVREWARAGDPELDTDRFTVAGFAAALRRDLSPMRRASLGPMLVERAPRMPGRRHAGTWSPGGEDYRPELAQRARDAVDRLVRLGMPPSGGARLNRVVTLEPIGDGRFDVLLEEGTSRAQLRDAVVAEGFDLPTEDEWEYLCGGGSRTFFRWGEGPDADTRYGYDSDPDVLAEPNRFGLRIAWDQFLQEVTTDPAIAKGGDGGFCLHDGVGEFPQLLPLSTFYRSFTDPSLDDDVAIGYYVYRRVLHL